MGYKVNQKWNVRLDAAHAEFLQAALDVASSFVQIQTASRHFHKQRIEVRGYHGARKRCASVEPDSHAAGRAVGRDPAVVGQKTIFGILGCHAALQGRAHRLDRRLVAKADLRVGKLVTLGHS